MAGKTPSEVCTILFVTRFLGYAQENFLNYFYLEKTTQRVDIARQRAAAGYGRRCRPSRTKPQYVSKKRKKNLVYLTDLYVLTIV